MAKYICTIISNFSYGREYEVETKSAMKCAIEHGRCEGGEEITVSRKCGTVISRVIYHPEMGYIRVSI